jgi:hypothetical protein
MLQTDYHQIILGVQLDLNFQVALASQNPYGGLIRPLINEGSFQPTKEESSSSFGAVNHVQIWPMPQNRVFLTSVLIFNRLESASSRNY